MHGLHSGCVPASQAWSINHLLGLQAAPTPRPASPPATKFAPFRLSCGNRPASAAQKRTTEELRLEELRARKAEEARLRRRVLARLQTAPAVLPHAASPRKATKPKPFNLMSVALHEAEVTQREAQRQARAAATSLSID
jgi:hypothetical protein